MRRVLREDFMRVGLAITQAVRGMDVHAKRTGDKIELMDEDDMILFTVEPENRGLVFTACTGSEKVIPWS